MLHLGNELVTKLIGNSIDDCIKAVEVEYREWANGEANSIPITVYLSTTSNERKFYQLGTMQAGSKHLKMFCMRFLNDIIHTREYAGVYTREKYCIKRGTYSGFILLLSTENAEPLALINDGIVQHMSVAASAGVGIKYLARKNSTKVAVLGSGGMARTFAGATCSVRKNVATMKVFSPTKSHANKYSKEISRKFGIDVISVDNPRDAVRDSDIVLCCTDSLKPVMLGEWLEPGMHVSAVTGEVDAEFVKRVDLNVGMSDDKLVSTAGKTMSYSVWQDATAYFVGKESDFLHLPQKKGIPKHVSFVNLPDIMVGKILGRVSDEQTTYSYPAGPRDAVRLLAVSSLVYRRAKSSKKGGGVKMPLDWFLQKVRD
jgi:alanine dehydrogenase